MSEVVRITRRGRNWHAWVGSMVELRRLASLIESLTHERRDEAAQQEEARRKEYEKLHPGSGTVVRGDGTQTIIVNTDPSKRYGNYEVAATITDGSDEIRGPLDKVFAEFDRRSHGRVEIEALFPSVGEDELSLKFNTDAAVYGVELKIQSVSTSWARQALVRLSDEIELGVPRWSKLHSQWGVFAFCTATFLCIFASICIVAWPLLRTLPASVILAAVATFPITMLLTSPKMRRWFFPMVQITAEGEESKGIRSIGYVIGLAVTFFLSVVVNLLTR